MEVGQSVQLFPARCNTVQDFLSSTERIEQHRLTFSLDTVRHGMLRGSRLPNMAIANNLTVVPANTPRVVSAMAIDTKVRLGYPALGI